MHVLTNCSKFCIARTVIVTLKYFHIISAILLVVSLITAPCFCINSHLVLVHPIRLWRELSTTQLKALPSSLRQQLEMPLTAILCPKRLTLEVVAGQRAGCKLWRAGAYLSENCTNRKAPSFCFEHFMSLGADLSCTKVCMCHVNSRNFGSHTIIEAQKHSATSACDAGPHIAACGERLLMLPLIAAATPSTAR